MIHYLLILTISVLLPSTGQAIELIGEGHGATRETAKQEALSDLSQSIATEVNSVHTGWKELLDGKYSEDATQMVRVESRLPLLGLETYVLQGVDDGMLPLFCALKELLLFIAKD